MERWKWWKVYCSFIPLITQPHTGNYIMKLHFVQFQLFNFEQFLFIRARRGTLQASMSPDYSRHVHIDNLNPLKLLPFCSFILSHNSLAKNNLHSVLILSMGKKCWRGEKVLNSSQSTGKMHKTELSVLKHHTFREVPDDLPETFMLKQNFPEFSCMSEGL